MNAIAIARSGIYLAAAMAALTSATARAEPTFFLFGNLMQPSAMQMRAESSAQSGAMQYSAEPARLSEDAIETPAHLRRQVVPYQTREAPGTIVIDTPNTYLYLVLGNGQAMRYGIGVGREGFTWSGVQTVDKKTEWPDWIPPQEMIARQPYLPRFVAGGPGNPLGARALYLSGTVYRIHGTNDPKTIGRQVSSGCIRLTNEDVSDLYQRVPVGTKVVVLPMNHNTAANAGALRSRPNNTIASAPRMPASNLY
jgi:lipoprotein-anchoring transpeptidase ErfK/SrfK